MSVFKRSNKVFLSTITASAALLVSMTMANAACGVVKGLATGPNLHFAKAQARQAASQKIAASLKGRPDSLKFSKPACYYLDNGTNAVNCSVIASFCTTSTVYQPLVPVAPKFIPVFSPRPAQHKRRGSYCSNFSTQVTASSLRRAKRSVVKAMNKALYHSCRASLHDPRVSGGTPACYYLGDGTNAAHCQIAVTFCR